MVTINSTPKEKFLIEKQGYKFEGQTTAKDFKGWLKGRVSKYGRENNLELQLLFTGIINAYEYYEKLGTSQIQGWKGESSIQYIKHPDRVIVIKYQRKDKDLSPEQIRIEITKQEINAVITSLNLLRENQPIKTKNLAMIYSKSLNLNHENWKMFFADRTEHNKLTIILNFLESEGLIKYSRSGNTKILKDKLDVQMLLL